MSNPTGFQSEHYRDAMTVNLLSRITRALKKTLTSRVPSVVLKLITEPVEDFESFESFSLHRLSELLKTSLPEVS